eukprot:gene29250-38320_t
MSGKVTKIVSSKRGKKKKQQKLPWNILKPDFLRDALWCENDVDFSQLHLHEKRVSEEIPSTPSTENTLNLKKDFFDIDIDPKVTWNRLLLGRQYARLIEKKVSLVEAINTNVVEVASPISHSHSSTNNNKSFLSDPTNSNGRKRRTMLRTREDIRYEMSELFEQHELIEQVESADSDDEAEGNSPLSSRQGFSGFSKQQHILVEERLRHKRESAKATLEVPILRGTTFTTFWIQFLKAHRSIYGYDDLDSDDDSFGDEVINNNDDDDNEENTDRNIVDVFVYSDAASNKQDEAPAVLLRSSSYDESLPAPSQEVILDVSAAIPVDQTIIFDDVDEYATAENASVSQLIDEFPVGKETKGSRTALNQSWDSRSSEDLHLSSRQRSQTLVLSAVDGTTRTTTPGSTAPNTRPSTAASIISNSASKNKAQQVEALSVHTLGAYAAGTVKSTDVQRIYQRRCAEIVHGPESIARNVRSPGNPKFASTLSKIMKKLISLEICDSPHLATSLNGVPVNHFPELLDGVKSRDGVLTAMTDSTTSSIPISLAHTTADLSWIALSSQQKSDNNKDATNNQVLSDDRTTEPNSALIPEVGSDDGIVPGQESPSEAFFITHTDIVEETSIVTFPSVNVALKKKDLRVKFGAQNINLRRNITVRHPAILDNYPIKKKGDGDYTEIRFVYQELRLHLFSYRSGKLLKFSDAHIGSIFVTNSVFIDMVTIRTSDTVQVPTGYLCTVPLEQWCAIEHEVSLCLLNMTHTTLQLHHKISKRTKAAVIPADGSVTSVVIVKPTKPQHPAPSIMSPSKLSRFKALIPSALAIPHRVKSEVFETLVVGQQQVQPPRDFKKEIADKISLMLNCGNMLSGFTAAGDVVSFVINGRHVRLWNELMVAQKDLRGVSMENFTDVHTDPSKPNIYIDLSGLQAPKSAKSTADSALDHSKKRKLKDSLPQKNSAGSTRDRLGSSRPLTMASSRPYTRTSVHPSLKLPGDVLVDIDQLDTLLHYKFVMIIDSQRLMQIYFVKKLLELDLMANVCVSFEEAAAALQEDPQAYSLILINCTCLLKEGVEESLSRILPSDLDRTTYMVAVYDVPDDDATLLEQLTVNGVNDILCEPYTTESLSILLESYRARQEHRIRFSRPVTTHTLID